VVVKTLRQILDRTLALLNEADYVGLWVKSDDCSDNRNKRRLLREALREATDGVDAAAAAPERNAELERELSELVAMLQPLPGIVTDIMGDNPQLDLQIMLAKDKVERLGATLPAA
jgi:hypothetical protein